MPVFTESPSSQGRKRKGILTRQSNSPRSSKIQATSQDNSDNADVNVRDGSIPKDNSLMEKIRQSFSLYKPSFGNDQNGGQNGKNAGTPKEGRTLSLSEARALSEFGKYLSETNKDHQGAIVTLMRVRTSEHVSSFKIIMLMV